MTTPPVVQVERIPNLMNADDVRHETVRWREGMTLEELLPDDWDAAHTFWEVDGEPAGYGDGVQAPVAPGARVRMAAQPGDLGIGSAISGAVQSGLDALQDPPSALDALDYLGFNPFLGEIWDWLVPSIPGRRIGDDSNTVYGWSGVAANYLPAGTPVPLLYGEHRVGPAVVAQDLEIRETEDGPESYLRLLCLVSDGTIAAIGQYVADQDDLTGDDLPDGLLIQGNTAANFAEVRAWVRMGNLDQEPIPGFDVLRTVYDVGLEILQEPEAPLVTDWTMASVFDMPLGVEADRARITLSFAGGLSKIKTDGSLGKATVELQVRVTRLDDAGVPTGSSIVLPSASGAYVFSEKLSGTFQRQVPVEFYDPETFVEPVVTNALSLSRASPKEYGAVDSAVMALLAVPGFDDSEEPDEFTLFMVCKLRSHNARNPLWCWGDWDEDEADPKVEGLMLWMREVADPDGNYSELVVWAGDSITASAIEVVGGDVDADEWFSVAVAYDKVGGPGGVPVTNVYVNAGLVGTFVHSASLPIRWVTGAGSSAMQINTMPRKETAGSGQWHGAVDYDEWLLLDRTLSSVEVAKLHAQGAWTSNAVSAGNEGTRSDIVVGATMDAKTAAATEYTQLFTSSGNPLTSTYRMEFLSAGTADVDVVTGAVLDVSGLLLLRDRYRVEVQRVNADSDSIKVADAVSFASIVLEVDERLGYAGASLVGLEILGSGQLNTSRPNVTMVAKGRRVPVWDGLSLTNPAFTLQWSQNPAWQAVDLLTAPAGLGQFFSYEDLRLDSFKEWADWCDSAVYDQKGKKDLEQVELRDLGGGVWRVVCRVTLPLPDHWVVGVPMKLRLVVPSVFPAVDGESLLADIEPVDATYTDLVLQWPGDIDGPRNLLGSVASEFDDAAWAWAGTAGTIDTVDSTVHIPPFLNVPVAEVVTFAAGVSRLRRIVTPTPSGALHYLAVYAKVVDGGGPFRMSLEAGDSRTISVVPDDGQFHRVEAFLQPTGTADRFRFGSWDMGVSRQLAVAGAFIAESSEALAHDEGAVAGTITPANLVTAPNALDDTDAWTYAGGLELLDVNVQDPIPYAPGLPELFRVHADGDELRQTGVVGSGDHYVAVALKITDALGTPLSVKLRAGDTYSSAIAVEDDGEWHTVGAVVSAATTSFVGLQFSNVFSTRQVLVGAVFAVASSVPVAYDGGVSLGETFATEPLMQSDLYYGDRGLGAWDALLLMMSVGRASPYRLGEAVAVRIERPRDPVQLFNAANIVAGTMQRRCGGGPGSRVNSLVGEIQSRELDYERDPVQRDHTSLEVGDEPSTAMVRRDVIDLRGITRRSQATRELDYRLEVAQRSCETAVHSVELEAAFVEPGEVYALVHPVSHWGQGAKVYEDAAGLLEFKTDQPFVLLCKNTLRWAVQVGELSAWELPTADPPTVTANAAPEPEKFGSEQTATRLDFPGGSPPNSRIRQRVASRGSGTSWVLIWWARAVSGTVSTVEFGMASDTVGVSGAVTPALTEEWTRVVAIGTHAAPPSTDPWLYARVRQDPTDASPRSVYVTRPRLIVGAADDGLDAEFDDATRGLERQWVGVRDRLTDVLSFALARHRSGEFAEGDTVYLDDPLPEAPKAGDLFSLGPNDQLTRFECVSTRLGPGLRKELSGVEFVDEAFRDADSYEADDVPVAPQAAVLQAAAASSASQLAAQPTSVGVFEEAVRDRDDGAMRKALVVGWQLDRDTAHQVDHVAVYAREQGTTGPWDLVGRAQRGQRSLRVPASAFPLEREATLDVVVVPVSRAGLHYPIRLSKRVAVGPLNLLYPLPPSILAGEVTMAGTRARYSLRHRQLEGADVEIVRGGVFIHQEVARVPVGGRSVGPTMNWSDLPVSSRGHGNVPLRARLIGPGGHPGEFTELTDAMDLAVWPAAVDSDSFEDGPWDTAGALVELVKRLDADGDVLVFDTGSSELEGTWTQTATIDLGRPRRVHVSVGVNGEQVHPTEFDLFPALDTVRGERWSFEGPLDPGDRLYGECTVTIQASWSTGASAGTDWREVSPGEFYLRTIRFRLVVTRPAATWDAVVSRLAYSIRPMPASESVANSEEVTGA